MPCDPLQLAAYCDELLSASRIRDACPNGVQVLGGRPVRRLAGAVSASLAAIEGAVAWGADALLVHHGLFWNKQPTVLRGSLRARVARLLAEDVTLLAYHLPLDVHPEIGHGACIARGLGLAQPWQPFGAYHGLHLGWQATLNQATPVGVLLERAAALLGPPLRVHEFGPPAVRRVAVASGDCPFLLSEAAAAGVQLLLTGEETEYVQEQAREEGLHFVAQGHYQTEVPGVQALAEALATRWDLEWTFVDVPNCA